VIQVSSLSPPRCFEEGLYDAARVVYARIPNYGRLASTLVRLHQFQPAVDAARKVRRALSAAYTETLWGR
jgi:hypothetical protein